MSGGGEMTNAPRVYARGTLDGLTPWYERSHYGCGSSFASPSYGCLPAAGFDPATPGLGVWRTTIAPAGAPTIISGVICLSKRRLGQELWRHTCGYGQGILLTDNAASD